MKLEEIKIEIRSKNLKASLQDIAEFEEKHDIKLHDEYKHFLTNYTNGGFVPGYVTLSVDLTETSSGDVIEGVEVGLENFESLEELVIDPNISYINADSEEEAQQAHDKYYKKIVCIADGANTSYFLGIGPDNFGEIWARAQTVDGNSIEKIADSFNQFIEKTYYLEED